MAAKHKKLKILGSGSFGKVWLVQREPSKENFVLKEIVVKSLTSTERDQALTEVEILAKCRHLNIIKYRSAYVDCETGVMGIIMELATQGDLQGSIDAQNGRLFDEKVVLDWFIQICYGLKYMHGLNIMHRDLKTQNIFRTENDIIKIGDFGISKILSATADCANTVVGTPFYLSPEICQQKPYNNKSDMWAAGCVLYNLCCLMHPFDALDFSQLVPRILMGRYEPLPGQFSQVVVDLVHVLLRQDPQQRPSAAQILCIRALQGQIEAYVKRTNQMRARHQSPILRSKAKKAEQKQESEPQIKKNRMQCIKEETEETPSTRITSARKASPVYVEESEENEAKRIGGNLNSPDVSGLKENSELSHRSSSKARLKTPTFRPQRSESSPTACAEEKQSEKENINPKPIATPEESVAKSQIRNRRRHTDDVTKANKRPALVSLDRNIQSVDRPVRKLQQKVGQMSPKQSLFRALVDKQITQRPKPLNLRGGKTYTVAHSRISLRQSTQPDSTVDQWQGSIDQNQSESIPVVVVNNAQEVVSSTGSTSRDVSKYLWNASIRSGSDSFGAQEMIRAFLEGRLGSTRVKAMFNSLKTQFIAGIEFEQLPASDTDIIDYLPLFIKLVEMDTVA